MNKRSIFSLMALAAMILLSGTLANAQFSTRPAPMWEGYEKTENDKKSDQEFIEKATKLAGGDANAAAQSLIEIGWQRIGQDPNHAIRAFNQAWLIKPDNPNIFWGFAVASHIRNDDLKTANRWFARTRQLMALKGLPDSARLEADQGRVLEERKLHEEARPYFEKALSIEPEHLPAHIGMVKIAKALGDKNLEEKHQKLHDELVK